MSRQGGALTGGALCGRRVPCVLHPRVFLGAVVVCALPLREAQPVHCVALGGVTNEALTWRAGARTRGRTTAFFVRVDIDDVDVLTGAYTTPQMMLSLVLLSLSLVAAFPVGEWHPAGPGDHRSPCPGLNALANHGYINRNGRNITRNDIEAAAYKALGVGYDVTAIATINAQIAAEIFPNGVMSSLWALNATHNVIEHDASLSRNDKYLGKKTAHPHACTLTVMALWQAITSLRMHRSSARWCAVAPT